MRHAEQQLLGVLDSLYEGMLDDEAWRRGLVSLADLVSGSAVALFSLNPATGRFYRADVLRADQTVIKDYQETWIHQDPRHAAALTCPIGAPQVDGMLVDKSKIRRTAFFNDFLKPADIPYHIATWIERSSTRGVVLSIQGSWQRGVFTEDERRRMAVLIPHMRRIVEMKDRLAQAQLRADGLLDAMDRMPYGLILLADDWNIVEASAAARALMTRRAGIHADGGRLGFVRSADERAFAARLKEDPNRARLNDSVQIPRPNSLPLSLIVLPLKPSQEQWMRATARWLVLVFDPDVQPQLPERQLQQALGITAAEAALVQRIASGLSVTEAAQQLGVTRNTVRAQLKSVYAKTGVNTQAQLVRRVLIGPALIGKRGRREP